MRFSLLRASLLAAFFSAVSVSAQAQKPVDNEALTAADILQAVREARGSRHDSINGVLRDDITDLSFPFRLVADGPQVRYEFKGPPPTAVQVRYNADGSELVESGPEGSGKLTPANFDKRILGTDVSYEDLALRFLYWTNATVEGTETVLTRPAWKIRLNAPNHRTQYSSVVVWVDKESGGLSQVEGYDWNGKLAKRFKVVGFKPFAGKTYLGKMRIEGFNPDDGHTRSRTYLELNSLAK